MTDMVTDQRNFMYLGDQSVHGYNKKQVEMYGSLIQEEFIELVNTDEEEPEEMLKEAIDLIVVTLGFIWSMGVDPSDIWKLVHKNNMSKVSNQDAIVKDEHGKIMKSPESKARKAKMMSEIQGLLNVHNS